jgi:hypothetical protein
MSYTAIQVEAQPPLRPNLAEARLFLAALDPDPTAQFGFRTFDDRGEDPRLAVKAFGTLDRGIRQSANPEKHGKPCRPARLLEFMQSMRAGAFVVPNKLDGLGQLKRNVVAIRALYVDADSRPEVERLDRFIALTGLTPTVLVASGGLHEGVEKLQCYWHVRGCPVAEFRDAQLTLVSRIGTDPAVQDAGRVMRLAGFWHQKREPRQTRILSVDPAVEYDFAEFMARVRLQPQICEPWARGRVGSQVRSAVSLRANAVALPTAGPKARLQALRVRYAGFLSPAARVLLRDAAPPTDAHPGNRHTTLVTVVGSCIQAGWPDGDIRDLVLPIVNTEWGDGDWSQHLDQILAWTREQHEAPQTAPAATSRLSRIAAAFGAGRTL